MDLKEKEVEKCEEMIKKGYSKNKIFERIDSNFDKEEIYEIARCRIDMRGKFSIHRLYFDKYGLRYSTPEIIADYRSRRVRNYTIADVSCGVGIQAIFFSFTNHKVLGIDIDPRRIEYAKRNAIAYNAKNIEFIVGNSLSSDISKIAKKSDIIFSDPVRKETEKERKLESLEPSPFKIIEKYGNKNYIFDLPPQISMKKIPENWEKEYISVNGKIKRLTVYTGELKKYDRRAVSLPSGEEIFSKEPDEGKSFTLSSELSNYIYIVDESIYYSFLLGVIEKKIGPWYISTGKRRTLATSENIIKSPFLKGFEVIAYSNSLDEIIKEFRKEKIGKVTLRMDIEPKDYWKIRKKIERKLKGDKKGSLFRFKDLFIGAKNVT